jgi:hypothetical protein
MSVIMKNTSIYTFVSNTNYKTVSIRKVTSWTGLTQNGNETTATTAITFTFDKNIDLRLEDIILPAGVTKGGLTNAGTTWTLGISSPTTGFLTVNIIKSGFVFAPKNVYVYATTAVLTDFTIGSSVGYLPTTVASGSIIDLYVVSWNPNTLPIPDVNWYPSSVDGATFALNGNKLTVINPGTIKIQAVSKAGGILSTNEILITVSITAVIPG